MKTQRFAIIALAILTAVILAMNMMSIVGRSSEIQTVGMGSYRSTVKAQCVVVRNETVLSAGPGIMEASVAEGERVRTSQSLGAVVKGEIPPETQNQIDSLNDSIEAIKLSMAESGVLTIDDSKVESALSQSEESLKYASAKHNVASMVKLASDIKILNARAAGTMSSDSASQTLAELETKRRAISSSLGGVREELYAPSAGIYSEKTDGLEASLNAETLDGITPEKTDELISLAQNPTDGALCKIVNNFKWYAVFNLYDEELAGMETNGSYDVTFKTASESTASGTVVSVSEPDGEGRRAVVMSFKTQIDDFPSIRLADIEICKARFEGIYVPLSAIRVKNGETGVYVRQDKTDVFKRMDVVFRTDDFVLAAVYSGDDSAEKKSRIALYDRVILNYEG